MNYPFKMIFVFVKIQMLKMSSMEKKKAKHIMAQKSVMLYNVADSLQTVGSHIHIHPYSECTAKD